MVYQLYENKAVNGRKRRQDWVPAIRKSAVYKNERSDVTPRLTHIVDSQKQKTKKQKKSRDSVILEMRQTVGPSITVIMPNPLDSKEKKFQWTKRKAENSSELNYDAFV